MSASAAAAAPPGRKEGVPPEGVPLRLALAGAGDRAAAFLLDFLLIALMTVGIGLVALLAAIALGTRQAGPLALAFALLGWFLVRSFYFTWFELRGNGRTPGKRRVGIRVIDGHGGMLAAEAVIVRNLMREVEVFLPGTALFLGEQIWPGAPGAAVGVAIVWLLIFALLPLMNRDRLRIGDLVGGTLVVYDPKPALLADLSEAAAASAAKAAEAERAVPSYTFTPEQLDIYGIYELQVLEDLLRNPDRDARAVEMVCDKIKRKIAWPRDRARVEPLRFLRDFYAAQRARLEHKLLLGKRKEHKDEGAPPPGRR